MDKELQQRMAQIRWAANKRTLIRTRPIPEAIIDECRALSLAGAFDEAAHKLEAQPDMAHDARALTDLALARFGGGDYDGALEALRQTTEVLDEMKSRVEVNRANILKVQGHYVEGLRTAYRARDLAPTWCGPHLMLVAILECRQAAGDRDMVKSTIEAMKNLWPASICDAQLHEYLRQDVDFSLLRRDGWYPELFEKEGQTK